MDEAARAKEEEEEEEEERDIDRNTKGRREQHRPRESGRLESALEVTPPLESALEASSHCAVLLPADPQW